MSVLTGKSTWDGGDVANQNQQKAIDMRDSNLGVNRADQINPLGSSTWSVGANGRPVQTTTLAPAQQQLLDLKNQTGANLGQASTNLSANMLPTLSQGLNTSGLTSWQNVMGGGATNLMTHDWLANSGNTSGGAVADAGTWGAYQPTVQATKSSPVEGFGSFSQPAGGSVGGGGSSGGGSAGGGQGVAYSPPPSSLPAAVAVPSSSSSSSSSSVTTSDPYKVRDTFDISGVKTAIPTTIDDTSRQRVEEALMSRLNPQLAQDTAALRNRLLNSGIEVGTDAYNRELTLDAQKGTDARMQAVLAGGQEEDRQTKLLQGLNDQQFQQALATGKFGQDADIAMANNATSRSNAATSAAATTGAAGIAAGGAMDRLKAQLAQQSSEFNVNTGFKAAAFNNDLRNAQLAEQILLRQEPLKELSAMQQLSSPTAPTFASYYTDSGKPVTQGPPQVIDSGNGLFDVLDSAGSAWDSISGGRRTR